MVCPLASRPSPAMSLQELCDAFYAAHRCKISVNGVDLNTLEPGQLVTDTVLTWYIVNGIMAKLSPEVQEQVCWFDLLFFTNLEDKKNTRKKPDTPQTRHARAKQWAKVGAVCCGWEGL